ncbi:Uncharacterized protein Adt_09855 [Abeliophyllum distichum]|uniref:Uncharacterized protein n=1 Tax=Abeliophyllum distichum TaxID=126358 RepID=A0ABD1UIC2_9LAMI
MNDQFVYESVRIADSDDNSSDDEDMDRIEQDIHVWLDYCRATESRVRDYLQRCRVRIRRFPNSRNGHIFMLEVLQDDPQIAFQEFRMYLPLFVNFTHLLRDEFGLSSGMNVDIYEQVVPANGKYYLIDSGFAHRTGYMAPYKGANIRYHFQEFRSDAS